ncbi:hypothetical protein B0H10DRAFT_2038933 [Mycena sp. CBHHK59/15]|nr:hypothetical protein B0H10DRAFT_2038933 [Mycena sp. CBHHK59/15]
MALLLEPRALKARYRRAMARKQLNLVPESLIDITSLLTTDPNNPEAKAEFPVLVDLQNESGRRALSPEDIVTADLPHAYGSASNPLRHNPGDLHQMTLPFFHRVIAAPRNSSPIPMVGACRTCKVTKGREDVRTCQKCHRANYRSVNCQRAD